MSSRRRRRLGQRVPRTTQQHLAGADARIADTFDRVDAMETAWVDAQEPYNEGTPYGMHNPDDAQFMVWFMQMAAADPYWPIALQFEWSGEGEKVWRRFERIARQDPMRSGMIARGVAVPANAEVQ